MNRSCIPEIKNRIKIEKANWAVFAKFIVSSAPLKNRRIILISLSVGALVSGFEAKNLTTNEVAILDGHPVARLRALLHGTAHCVMESASGESKHVALSNLEVYKKARVPPPHAFVDRRLLQLLAFCSLQILDQSFDVCVFCVHLTLHISADICMFLTFSVASFRARRRWHSANAAAEK